MHEVTVFIFCTYGNRKSPIFFRHFCFGYCFILFKLVLMHILIVITYTLLFNNLGGEHWEHLVMGEESTHVFVLQLFIIMDNP